jgi:P-type Ca2+ transporter type 2C
VDASRPERKPWHSRTAGEVAAELTTDPVGGLSRHEAHRRLSKYGPNTIEEQKRKPAIYRFLLQFNDFMIYVLLGAIVISGAWLHEYVDAVVILVIVLLNAVLGFVQESRAETALRKLKELGAPTVKVVRDGSESEIPARDLVPGDLIVLETGDVVPADARLALSVNLQANESSLTGESVASTKDADVVVSEDAPLGDRQDMVYSGTHIEYGRGTAIVAETGSGTQLGEIAGMLQEGKAQVTPLQVELRDVGRRILYICLITVVVVFVVGVARGNPTAMMLLVAVSLAVAAIPEGLPAIVTITLARGTQVLAKHNAIIRHLPAVETLGSANYICSDKTGTLTLNRMKVTDIIFADSSHYLVEDILHERAGWRASAYSRMEQAAALCNDARGGEEGYIGDPTEIALLEAAESGGLNKFELEEDMPRLAEVPFDSDRKMMSTAHRDAGGFIVFAKGAAEEVLRKCDRALIDSGELELTDEWRRKVLAESTELGSQGLRTLAVAYRKLDSLPDDATMARIESGLVFLGAFAMKDPPRPEAMKALAECRRAKIQVAMITGDHRSTAGAIARELGILVTGKRLIDGAELEKMSAEQLTAQVEDIGVYARVSPRHKVKIVEALQARGHVVAMTGDGVNDAPALKRADIGVAMGVTGTDVAKEASDMVLADDNFATIVSAVRQGRIIFGNLKKSIYFLLSCNISEVLIIFIAMVAGLALPLVAAQILWINLVTDGLPALALGVDAPEVDVMEKPPRDVGENILSVPRQLNLLWMGAIITAGGLASYLLAYYILGYPIWPNDPATGLDMARTVLFTTMVLTQVLHSFNLRSETRSILRQVPWENAYLFGSLLTSLALQMFVLYVPFMQKAFHTSGPTWQAWILILVCAIVPVLLIDRIKVGKAWAARKKA